MLAWRVNSFIHIGRDWKPLDPQQILEKLSTYLVLLFSLSVHESAHAWSALKMGDDTAQKKGRISLNPLVHIDPVGTVFLPLIMLFAGPGFIFGWAKPVPICPDRFRHDRKGQILSAGAGPLSNFVLAVIFTGLLGVSLSVLGPDPSYSHPLVHLLWMGLLLNIVLGVFNLTPIPPLDGSWIVSLGLPRDLGAMYDRFFGPYGYMVLLLLFITGGLDIMMRWCAWPIILFLGRVAQAFGSG